MKIGENQYLVKDISESVERLFHQIRTGNLDEQFLREIMSEYDCTGFEDITLTECHVIDCIENNPQMNAVGISRIMSITKGGISKVTAKLLRKHLIEAYRLEGNRKEIFYRLTPLGKRAFKIHQTVHARAQSQLQTFLEGYSEGDLSCIKDFIEKMNTFMYQSLENR